MPCVARRSLWGLLAVAACGRLEFAPVPDGGADGGDGAQACTFGAFSSPMLVPELNTADQDWAPHISPDGLSMYLSQRTGSTAEDLHRATRATTDAAWVISPVTELNTASNEEDDVTATSDDLEIFFGKVTMFRATRPTASVPFGPAAAAFSAPPAYVGVQGFELSSDDLTMYFTLDAGGGTFSMHYMTRTTPTAPFGSYLPLLDPDPTGSAGWPTLSADELEIFFSSDHGGQRDIWTSRRGDRLAPFPAATLVSELSSIAEDWDPELSLDGKTLWFASNRAGATGQDIYVATRSCL